MKPNCCGVGSLLARLQGVRYIGYENGDAVAAHCSPLQINKKIHGKTAVHVACTEGFIGCLRCLLFYHPDLEIMVRPLALLTISSSFSCV